LSPSFIDSKRRWRGRGEEKIKETQLEPRYAGSTIDLKGQKQRKKPLV